MYGAVGLLVLILDVVALVSVLTGNGSVSRKAVWTVLVLLLPVLGMVLYFLIGRNAFDARLSI